MKFIRNIIIVLIVLVIGLVLVIKSLQVEVVEEDLPLEVYEENTSLPILIQSRLFTLFTPPNTSDYSLVEEVINYVLLDSIQENINASYNPLGSCDTNECNRIVSGEDYYVDYLWATIDDSNQLVVHVGVGSNTYLDFHTIIHLHFDIDIQFVNTTLVFTLEDVYINNLHISVEILDLIFGKIDKDAIEEQITTGTLDLDDFTYEIKFSFLP